MNPFLRTYGTDNLRKPLPLLILLSVIVLAAKLTADKGLLLGIAFMVLPLAVIYLCSVLLNPRIGIITIIIFGFFVIGLSRYVPATWGLINDGLMFLMYLSLFFKAFHIKIPWDRAKSHLTILVAVWFGYAFIQVANPEAASRVAWFYAMRGLALYQFLLVPLCFILFNKPKDLRLFLYLWGALSVLGTLKGCMQLFIGVDPFEQKWLDGGGHVTHILFGKLRIFSFYSDAGQFGASQGHAGVLFGVLALYTKKYKERVFFIIVALAGLYGMLISGTRGAIAVPAMGGIMFLILRKNIPILVLGAVMGIGVYVFFAHTTIMNNNAQIRRMRTAFDPNDASLQVRLANQKKLSGYLASRPFGGGIGSTGNWGQRFTPNTFLANTATDSWFVAIWADMGIVGLYLHLFILFFILITGAYNVMFKLKDERVKGQIAALVCGMAGIMLASYGNGVFGQFPTGILMYVGMVFIFLAPRWEKQRIAENRDASKVVSAPTNSKQIIPSA
ncbi:Putative membrane protein [Croceitalea dokdonensis DOKDO 023]|uniref:Putative membrane protein n=1 Tax=Croceitalea dokdonensis DOKDO 023 TaxID=1300341 RepID=A0A0P7ARP7_9FLAO|nr:O-antigen ligase family protein [Croceitalea dokdonensis]KPM31194.1 Putative membrane protein [Croceitalea dokdonensis DOKDO 023]